MAAASEGSSTEPQQTGSPVSEETHREPFTLVGFENSHQRATVGSEIARKHTGLFAFTSSRSGSDVGGFMIRVVGKILLSNPTTRYLFQK